MSPVIMALCEEMMNMKSLKHFMHVLIIVALLINENVIQWALAVIVGNYSVKEGLVDAFKYFTVGGYAFFTAFRVIPYFILWLIVKSLFKKEQRALSGIAWGGLFGVVFAIVCGSWMAQHAYYTDEHVSSTTAIAFIFIPLYAVVTGIIGGILGGIVNYATTKLHNIT